MGPRSFHGCCIVDGMRLRSFHGWCILDGMRLRSFHGWCILNGMRLRSFHGCCIQDGWSLRSFQGFCIPDGWKRRSLCRRRNVCQGRVSASSGNSCFTRSSSSITTTATEGADAAAGTAPSGSPFAPSSLAPPLRAASSEGPSSGAGGVSSKASASAS